MNSHCKEPGHYASRVFARSLDFQYCGTCWFAWDLTSIRSFKGRFPAARGFSLGILIRLWGDLLSTSEWLLWVIHAKFIEIHVNWFYNSVSENTIRGRTNILECPEATSALGWMLRAVQLILYIFKSNFAVSNIGVRLSKNPVTSVYRLLYET